MALPHVWHTVGKALNEGGSALPHGGCAVVHDLRAAAKAAIIAGDLHPFTGPINDQDGNEVLAAGEVMDDGAMLGMMFFVEGVIGSTG